MATISILFFGALYAITGLSLPIQPLVQVNFLFLGDVYYSSLKNYIDDRRLYPSRKTDGQHVFCVVQLQ